MQSLMIAAPILGVIALLFALFRASLVNKAAVGTDRMKEIADAIAEGARAFLFAEYKILVIFVVVLGLIIGFLIGWVTAICFLVGAVFSVLAGFFGMTVATKANVRTANAARESGMNKALSVAFSGGAVMGMCVVGLGILGVSLIYIFTGNVEIMFGFIRICGQIICFPMTSYEIIKKCFRICSLSIP